MKKVRNWPEASRRGGRGAASQSAPQAQGKKSLTLPDPTDTAQIPQKRFRRWDRISWPFYLHNSLFFNIDETQNGKVILSHLLSALHLRPGIRRRRPRHGRNPPREDFPLFASRYLSPVTQVEPHLTDKSRFEPVLAHLKTTEFHLVYGLIC
jgi:hypothetical protein